MGFERTHNRGASESAAAVAWSISFGDLLTLLVCFFLVLTQSTVFTRVESHKDGQVIVPGDLVKPAGTSLATEARAATAARVATVPRDEPRLSELTIEIPRSRVGHGVIRTLSEEFDEAFVQLFDQSQGRRGYLKVQLCSQEYETELATEVHRFIEQSKQQLTGWEVEPSSVCKVESRNAVSDVVAVIEFSEPNSR
jgi:flagellar motor protein MotB